MRTFLRIFWGIHSHSKALPWSCLSSRSLIRSYSAKRSSVCGAGAAVSGGALSRARRGATGASGPVDEGKRSSRSRLGYLRSFGRVVHAAIRAAHHGVCLVRSWRSQSALKVVKGGRCRMWSGFTLFWLVVVILGGKVGSFRGCQRTFPNPPTSTFTLHRPRGPLYLIITHARPLTGSYMACSRSYV